MCRYIAKAFINESNDGDTVCYIRYIDTSGTLGKKHICSTGGGFSTGNETYGVRVIITLKDGVTVGDGNGTADSPYQLVIEP